jgi:Mrp family chromosome partitioning ATPase
MSDDVREVVNELCVQAEAQEAAGAALTIVVTGSQRVAGTTTLATAIAARFGEQGLRVALIDLDFEKPDLAEFYGVPDDGFAGLLSLLPPEAASREEGPRIGSVWTATPFPNVSVVGRSRGVEAPRPQRADLLVALDTAVMYADVVVLDAGPALGSPASGVLAQHADAIVLAVPVRAQDRWGLRLVARQLVQVRSYLLPVSMPRVSATRAWLTHGSARHAIVSDDGHEEELAIGTAERDSALR